MPPLAFTQAKYAWAMFAMSVKLVPGWSVTMPPRLIGVPVAATPGLVPHWEVLTVEAPVLEPADGAAAGLEAAGPAAELELELLLLQPARTPPTVRAATAAPASRERQCSCLFMCSAFSWLTAKYVPNGRGGLIRVRPAVPGVSGERAISPVTGASPDFLCIDRERGLCPGSHRVVSLRLSLSPGRGESGARIRFHYVLAPEMRRQGRAAGYRR